MATWPAPHFDDTKARFEFDDNGPAFQGVKLLHRDRAAFAPKSVEDLEAELLESTGHRFDCSTLSHRLDVISRALNQGDIAKAAVATGFIDPPCKLAGLAKASVDDPKHPGWPRDTPDSKGGEFRPKDDAGLLTAESKSQKVARLRQRRSFRAILRRVLTTKRAARIVGEWVGDLIPGVDTVAGAATIVDDLQLLRDIADEVSGSQAALDFAEHGPFELSDLLVSSDDASFGSYYEFWKLDFDLDKRFGSAGDGYQYHHLVEQGPNTALFSQNMLQSTSNIIKLPTIVHEDINALYASSMEFSTGKMPLRQYLKGASFEQQRAWAIWALQRVGAIK